MPTPNLEDLITDESERIADQMNQIAQWAQSEEDVRYECNKLIDGFLNKAGLEIKGTHEYELARGRIDSKYAGVIIEYKNPHSGGRIREDRQTAGTRAVIQQLRKRFEDFQAEESLPQEKLFGAGTDAKSIVFLRYRGGELEIRGPKPITPYTVEWLLRAIVSLGAQGKSFTPDHLTTDFSSASPVAQKGVRQLYKAIRETENPKARTLFNQWKILFGEVCGYDVEGQNDKIRQLAEHYEISGVTQPAELLFAVHSYYAIFIKFLAAEIVSTFSPLGTSTLKKCVNAHTAASLRREMEQLEQEGGIWSQLGITNFLEGDLFSWYLDAWNESIAEVVWDIVRRLDVYDPVNLSADPEESQDLLKKLYQQLFPKSIRHDLGEYYTPDWLSEHVLEELDYNGNPNERLLDPACGSGTFLVMAINRIKAWFAEHRHQCGYGEDELVQKILNNVIGFDLNPLAVLASRTNYLLSIRQYLRYTDRIELPIYLCDSIVTPTEYGGLFAGAGLGNAKKFGTAVGEFLIPVEVVSSPAQMARYVNELETCISNNCSTDEFIARCEEASIPVSQAELHKELYSLLIELDKEDKNGIWTRIIKNAFAPAFTEPVDYIVGNPPWIAFKHLPAEYRESIDDLWVKYNLRPQSGWRGRFAKGDLEFSTLFVYSCLDHFSKPGTRLGFVITQTIFQSIEGGRGFRNFHLPDGQYIVPDIIHDLSKLDVFEGAQNRTSVMTAHLSDIPSTLPFTYKIWNAQQSATIPEDSSYRDVLERLISLEDRNAVPIDFEDGPWILFPSDFDASILHNVLHGTTTAYDAHIGAHTRGANAVYWLRVLDSSDTDILIENTPDLAKKKVTPTEKRLEKDLVYPLLRGKDVQRWSWNTSLFMLYPHEGSSALEEQVMKTRYPQTYNYLDSYRDFLSKRRTFDLGFRDLDFYALFETGDFLTAPYKVVFRELASGIKAAAVSPAPEGHILSEKPIIPDHKLLVIATTNWEEACFVAGLINCSIVRLIVDYYSISTSISTHLLNTIAIPRFDPTITSHKQIARISAECHSTKNSAEIFHLETELDSYAAEIWDIPKNDITKITKSL